MNWLHPQHVIWLNRGMALGYRMRVLKSLLDLAWKTLHHRAYSVHTNK